MSAWRPIEGAPKDGDPVLVTIDGPKWRSNLRIVYWAGVISDTVRPGFSNVGWHDWHEGDEDEDEPLTGFTHWMPLTEAPA